MMKVDRRKEIECVQAAFNHLPNVQNYTVSGIDGNGFSAAIKMEDGYQFTIQAHTLQNAYPSVVKKILEQKKADGLSHVLVAPYISDRTAVLCSKNGIGYFDYAGNCCFSGHSVYLSERGHKNPEPEKRNAGSVFERSSAVSSMILREMFADTKKVWRQKYLSEKVGCSIGQVSKVMDYLLKNAWAEKSPEGYFLSDPAALLQAWSRVYGKTKQTAYSFYSLDTPAEIEGRLRDLKDICGIDAYLTGFSGGVRYSPSVRYNKVHAFIAPKDIQEAVKFLEIKEVSSGANVRIYPLEHDVYIRDCRAFDGNCVVSPVQIYLDCMQLAGRGEEMAEAVLNKEILK